MFSELGARQCDAAISSKRLPDQRQAGRSLRAHSRRCRIIGLLRGQAAPASPTFVAALRQGLADAGFIEGRSLSIIYRSAEGDIARLPAFAAELVRVPVMVIVAVGGDDSVRSAKAATATIPIVFTTAGDPVANGIVSSFNRPGGNVTGVTFLGSRVATKHIGLLRDILPKLETIGLLTVAVAPSAASITREVQEVAQKLGCKAVIASVNSENEIDMAFAQFGEERVDGVVISSGVFFARYRDRLITLAARHAIPSIATERDYTSAGGLMSYGSDIRDSYRQAGLYAARILRGDKPNDLPVMQAARFQLLINMKTAKSLGLAIPSGLLAIADEVIE